ncbi:MAG: DUF4249 domain-containing protein [Reichenbachiella sp.]|uniref:DUF4249 domain-containing protein n=1 Tax=Reichenbachiella sp. TaxID=2184521 RepID=UPI003296EEDE
MIRVKKHIILCLVGLIYSSCIDPIDLDLDTGESHLVVYGWITNEVTPYEIKLSESNGYSDQSGYPAVLGAEVYVTDHVGNRYDFNEIPGTGKYQSDPVYFVGSPGSIYQLTVLHNQERYSSTPEEMPALSAAEDAFVNFIADPADFEIDPEDENFFLSAFVDDDSATANYYRWKVYVNGELRNSPEELVLFDDQFTNGNKFKFDAGNVLFTQSDEAYFQHMSLSKGAFDYYNNLKEQISNSTLSPRVLPGIVEGNMANLDDSDELVLGYFGASEVSIVNVGQ